MLYVLATGPPAPKEMSHLISMFNRPTQQIAPFVSTLMANDDV